MQVGMTKDQGLYNKPSAAVHPGAIRCRDPTTIQYNTTPSGRVLFQELTGPQFGKKIPAFIKSVV